MTDNNRDTKTKKLDILLSKKKVEMSRVIEDTKIPYDSVNAYRHNTRWNETKIDVLIKYLENVHNESDNYKILIERLRNQILKEPDLSKILHFVDEIIEERKAEFRGLVPACPPGESAGKKSKLKKE